jgi:hypothetical protein
MIRRFLAIAAIFLLGSCGEQGGLTTPSGLIVAEPIKRLALKPAESTTAVVFHLENRGKQLAAVSGVASDCGCVMIDGVLPEIAPGEQKPLELTFRPTVSMAGTTQEKTLKLSFRDSEETIALRVIAEIPMTVTTTPATLHWKEGETGAKEIVLEVAVPMLIKEIRSSHASFQGEPLEENEAQAVPKNTHRIKVHLRDAQNQNSLLLIRTSLPGPWSSITVPLKASMRSGPPK